MDIKLPTFAECAALMENFPRTSTYDDRVRLAQHGCALVEVADAYARLRPDGESDPAVTALLDILEATIQAMFSASEKQLDTIDALRAEMAAPEPREDDDDQEENRQ